MSGSVVIYDAQDVTYATATDYIGGVDATTPLVVQRGCTKLRISLAPSAAGLLSVKVGAGATAFNLNSGVNLVAGALSTFDLEVAGAAATTNVKIAYSVNATLYHVNIKAIIDEVA